MTSVAAAPPGASTALPDLDAITDEERLRTMWQTAEDFGDRRRIRARMYRLREQRLREMMQNDEESLGTLNIPEDSKTTEKTETTLSVSDDGKTTTRRSSNIQVTMHVDGDTAVTDSISTQNVRLGGLTMRGVDTVNVDAEEIIKERIRKASKDRTTRYQQIIGDLSDNEGHSDGDTVVSITKSTYSIQSNALAGEGYISMKNKEVRDSVSPTRIMRERRSSAEDDTSANEGRLTSDDEAVLKAESENVIKAIDSLAPKTSTSRKSSREERTSTTKTSKTRQSEIPVRKEPTRKVSERKTSRELDLSSARRTTGDKSSPTSPTKRTPGESSAKTHTSRRTGAQKEAVSASTKAASKTNTKTTSSKKSKLAEIEAKMETSIMSELDKLDSYLTASVDDDDEVIMEEEEDCVDDAGNVVKMLVQTRRKKDGTECTARRVARSTKIVNNESEIDEILIGNPDHEVIERNVAEEEDKEGNKIKIITETRQRPDGIVYTTKNILKTSKIFDYDHPEDVAYNEEDELISTDETEETDENGCTIQTVTETRRKANGIEYTTKKVYKTSKVKSTQITPSDDDEVIDTQETEEKKDDGSIIRTLIETRRTKNGEEYTHRQVFKSRRMTLSGVDLQKGMPTMQNDDEVLDKKEKEETDENGMKIKIVTETRQRKDGSTYSFDYVLRSFQGTEEDMMKMPVSASSSSNIAVSAEDELINEEVKEDVQEDGSTVKTIIERRRAKDGTEYLRHRVMRIPKMPEPVLQVANLEDEVLQEEVNEETLDDGTHYKAVTERRRSSVSGLQYTLRRMSKVYQSATHQLKENEDKILDENVVEEETEDGTIIKTVIQRYQRPDGSVYTTHNIHKMFSSPAPVTFVGTENDELIDQSVDEQETEDGCVIKTVTETRRRSDGVQYTVERAEKSAKYGPQIHISFNANQPQKPEDVVQVGSLDDTVLSSEEQEHEEEDGTIVKTIIEVRRRVDGTEYTAKTVLRSTPVLVPERETSYVVIKPEGGDEDDESGLFPSLDDEIVYTRKREEKDGDGNAITVIIETRQTKSGEKYNITKRVHTKDVIMTEEGEKEIPTKTMKSTLVANLTSGKTSTPERRKHVPSEAVEDHQDDVPYGSVSALKNRFAPGNKKADSDQKSLKPDRLNTSNKKKFFEDAAKEAAGKIQTSTKSFSPKPLKIKKEVEGDKDKASIEVKLRIGEDKVNIEDVEAHNVTYHSDEIAFEKSDMVEAKNTENTNLDRKARLEDEENYEKELELEPEPLEEPEDHVHEPELEDLSPAEEEPHEKHPKKSAETKKSSPITKRSEDKPKKKQDLSPRKKPESHVTSRKLPSKDDSPTRRIPAHKEHVTPKESTRRVPKPNTSPQRVPNSPRRGRSPNRSGVSTPREVTPTGRQCCKRHREANAAPETVSPTRTQKTTRSTAPTVKKTGSPEGKPRMNGDVRRPHTEPKMNGDVNKRPEDRTSRTRRPLDKTNETEKATPRSSRLSQTPRKAPTARSPDKREPARSPDKREPGRPADKREPARHLSTRATDKKVGSKPIDSDSKDKPKSSLNLPDPTDPIVTLPATPMTEDMKPLPIDEEDVVIEDVSNEPDLPYHTIHRPSIVREPSEYNAPDENNKDDQPEDSSEESPEEKEPVKEETIKSRKPKTLESRPSDKSLTSKKQPETKRPLRDRPWLTEKRNSFEKKPSESKLTADKKKLFERKPSDDKLKKIKDEKKPTKKAPVEDLSPSEDEGKENGVLDAKDDSFTQEIPEDSNKAYKKTEEVPSRLTEDIEKSVASQIIVDKNVTTTTTADVSARRSLFNRGSPADKKKDTPTRKPSYEIKESVFSKRSMFEQPKQDSVPSPIKRPTLRSPVKKDDSYKKPEERKPVREPIIVPKYFHPLGDGDDEPTVEPEKKVVEEERKLSSSKLVMNASAEISRTSKMYESEKPEDVDDGDDNLAPLKKQRSPSPFSKESSPVPRSKEGSPAPFSKEGSPAPFSKEGSPNRFTTGRPVDSGINSNKIRRIERTASNKKLFEDLEVSKETLPQYIKNIDNILDVIVLENMLEQAVSYEERRLIRGQIRIAKKHNQTTTPSSTSSATYKRFGDYTPSRPCSTASPQPSRTETKPANVEKPKDSYLSENSVKPLSRLEEPQPSTEEPSESTPAKEPLSTRHGTLKDEPSEETVTDFAPDTREPSRRLNRRTVREPSPEPKEDVESPRSRKRDDNMSSPREPKRQVKSEEPRRYGGRTTTPEEPKKYESPAKPRETSKPSRVQPLASKAAPSNEPYIEPLRYQKKQGTTPSKPATAQTDVDKIVSPYGLGPTDDHGMPLFGLRALKKKSPPTTCASTPREEEKPTPSVEEPLEPSSPEKAEKEYVPTDASGQPIFGLRALKKATSSVNATERAVERPEVQETRETASPVVESSRLVSGIVTQRQTHAKETSPGLVRSLRDSFKRKETSEDLLSSGKAEDEVITKRSKPLRDILKLHEAKVQEPATVEESPRFKPKQRLRENFEVPERQDSRIKTWDLESDLSTRSLDMKNIIARHETITTETSPKPEKKLTGILKKTSSTNILGTDKSSSTTNVERHTHEDQITQLSEEFDLRAQDDGVIKTEESLEELSGGYRVSRRTEADYPDGAKFERKTSYTEIKLQQPNKEERSRIVTSSSSATVEHTGSSFNSSSSREAFRSSTNTKHVTSEEGNYNDEDDGGADMREGRSFLEDRSKVTGFGDVLSRMGATEAVDHESQVTSDDQARSLLNKFLGAQVLMTGVESMMASSSMSESSRVVTGGDGRAVVTQQASGHSASAASKDGALTHHSSKSYNTGPQTITLKTSSPSNQVETEKVVVGGVNISEVTDDFELNQLLDSCDQYEDRRKIRMRLKTLMAEKKALREELSGHDLGRGSRTQGSSAQKFEAMSKTTNNNSKESSLRSSEGDSKASSTMSPFGMSRTSTTDTRSSSQVNVQKSSYSSNVSSSTTSSFKTSSVSKADSKSVVSPFDKFKQMDSQTPRTPRE